MNEMWAIVKIDIIRGIVSLKHRDRDINTSDSVSRSLGHFSSNHSGWRKNRSTNLFSKYIIRSSHVMNGIGWIFPTLTWVQRCVPLSKFYFHLIFNLEKKCNFVSFKLESFLFTILTRSLFGFETTLTILVRPISFFVLVKCVMLDSVRLVTVSDTVFRFFFLFGVVQGECVMRDRMRWVNYCGVALIRPLSRGHGNFVVSTWWSY